MRWVLIALAFIALTVGTAAWLGRPRPVALTVAKVGAGSKDADLRMDRIRDDLRRLTSAPTRQTGSPGAAAAADYIQETLRGLNAEVDTYAVEVPVPSTAVAVLRGQGGTGEIEVPLHPLWPNLARTGATPAGGLDGPLLDIGTGSETELSGKALRGALVVMDWGCNLEWLSVPEFGGRAVIFRANDEATCYTARGKFLSVPADVPRYYVASADLPALDRLLARSSPTAIIHCESEWQPARAVSILARLNQGTAAAGSADAAPVVFHAYYDSVSVVPDLAPGAEQACGAAVLLELARYFAVTPARRPVYALFTSGHGQALAGMIDITARLRQGLKEGWPEAQKTSLLAKMGRPGLLVGLDLSSRSDRCGIFALGRFRGQYEHLLRPKFSVLGDTLDKYAQSLVAAPDSASGAAPSTATPYIVDCVNLTRGRGWWTYFPYQAPFESEVPVTAGIPAITLATVNDDRRYVDTPGDRFDLLRLDILERKLTAKAGERPGLAAVARAIAEWSGPFVSSPLLDVWADLNGRVVWLDQEKDYTPNQPLNGALVFLKTQRGDKHLMGTRGIPATFTDANGKFVFPGLLQMTDNWQFQNCLLEAYGTATPRFLDANPTAVAQYCKILRRAGKPEVVPRDGSLIYDIDMARQSDYPWTVEMKTVEQDLNLVCFPCSAVTLTGLTDPRGYIPLKDAAILEASTLSSPFQFGRSSPDALWGDDAEALVTLWGDPTLRVMLTLGLGFQGKRLILINNSVDQPEGKGFVLDDLRTLPSMVLQGAGDMWRLDESRIRKLERNGVRNPRLRQYHDEARQHLDAAQGALERSDWRAYRLSSEKGWALEGKAYAEVLSVINNMIRGVLFYLALLLPFSYCLERLLIAAGTIKSRVFGIAGIFSACFLLLAVVHPAFRFTLTPFLVLLAFIIVALVATVAVLIVVRMDTVLQERKRALVGRHDEQLNVGGIAVRAVDLGISNIRRRPQRGFLTGLTVVMVTFILLSFTSLTPVVSISRLHHPEGVPSYRGLLIRDRGWQPLPLPLQTSVDRTFAPGADTPGTVVAARSWFFSDRSGQLSQVDLAAVAKDRESGAVPAPAAGDFTAVALVGMDPQEAEVTEVARTLVAGRWFASPEEPGIILPQHMATQLGLGNGAEALGRRVRLFGQEVAVIGVFDAKRFDALRDIDGEPLTPVNFVLQQEIRAKATSQSEKPDTLEQYIHYASDQVAIVPFEFAMRIGATIRSVAVRAAPGTDLNQEAEGYTKRSNLTILACDGSTVTLYAAMDTSQLSAAWQIIVPLFLGFVMVLGTMMGSVYERRREIFVYNSVGLAPGSVSALFLAESTVYAIIGAGLGYLLGQAAARLFQATGLLGGLTLNYTAGTTILVTVLTMLIVLLSTVYPARQAYHAATPDTEKEGADVGDTSGEVDVVSIYLPFVTLPSNAVAMQAYMAEFLASIEGVTVGQLAVDQLRCRVDEEGCYAVPTLTFRAWLAPFDLGISHDVDLRVVFREDRGICQYHLRARRFSGDHQNWRRMMPRFVFALRRQLLMWRVLTEKEIDTYRERGRHLFPPASSVASLQPEARP